MNEKLVACWGSFDGELHDGHLYFLNECAKLGEQLYVFVVHDEVIKRNKNRSPIFTQEQRVKNIFAIPQVTLAVALLQNDEENYIQVCQEEPQSFCFGADQNTVYDSELEKRLLAQGAQIVRVERIGDISTTKLYYSSSS